LHLELGTSNPNPEHRTELEHELRTEKRELQVR